MQNFLVPLAVFVRMPRLRSWLQSQFFPPLKIALPDNGEICAGVFRRSKLAQFAASLLANHKFWPVVPLREKPASSSPTQPPKGGSVRWFSDMSEELPGATIARRWAEEAPKPPLTSTPSASAPEQASDASPPRGDEKATVATPSGVASHKQSIANPSMASATRNSLPIYAANPEIARIILSQSAELGRQPDFRVDSNHLGLAYMVHHILQCALREEIILPPGIDRIAASRFVEAVFAAAHRLFRQPGINAAETAQPSRPLARERNPQVDAAQGSWF